MSGFLMSDTVFLKKMTDKLNSSTERGLKFDNMRKAA